MMNNTFAMLGIGLMALGSVVCSAAEPVEAETVKGDTMPTEKAIFAAGCFWGIELKFSQVEGVVSTRVGYTGGSKDDPTYRDVCSKSTGHAEAVEVEFDPAQVSYDQLLDRFWAMHDPTTLNRQGPDVGDQYRSAVFCTSAAQRDAALASKAKLAESGRFPLPVVTEIGPASEFWPAEEYHQKYLEKRGRSACNIN